MTITITPLSSLLQKPEMLTDVLTASVVFASVQAAMQCVPLEDLHRQLRKDALGCMHCTGMWDVLYRRKKGPDPLAASRERPKLWTEQQIRTDQVVCDRCRTGHAALKHNLLEERAVLASRVDAIQALMRLCPPWYKYVLRGATPEVPVRVVGVRHRLPDYIGKRYAASPHGHRGASGEQSAVWLRRYELELVQRFPAVLCRAPASAKTAQTTVWAIPSLVLAYADESVYSLCTAQLRQRPASFLGLPSGTREPEIILQDNVSPGVLELVTGWCFESVECLLRQSPVPAFAFATPLGFQHFAPKFL